MPEALDRLIQFYTVTNKPNEVKKWQAEKYKLFQPAKKKKLSLTLRGPYSR